MAEHFTRATEYVIRFCDRCARVTQHSVSAGHLGRCMEHEAPAESREQQKAREKREREKQNPPLF